MAARRADVAACDGALTTAVDLLTPLVIDGKHVRPAFVWWGHVAVAGEPSEPGRLLRLAASLDLLHAGLLAHDDLIDDADTRRGRPSTHKAIEALPSPANPPLGQAGALIGGAWLMQWSQQMADECGLSDDTRAVLDDLRSRVLTGQMADAWAAAGLPLRGPSSSNQTLLSPAAIVAEIGEFKTTSYTITGPLQLGATVAGANARQLAALHDFGRPLGRAYQARDDMLGIFGDPAVTGKPVGDDLRQGKLTMPVQAALAMASPSDVATLKAVLGDRMASPDEVAAAIRIIADCGAADHTERSIADDLADALAALADAGLTADGVAGLTALAKTCIERDH